MSFPIFDWAVPAPSPARVGARRGLRTTRAFVPRWCAHIAATCKPAGLWAMTAGARFSGTRYGTLDNSDSNGAAYTGVSRFVVADVRVLCRVTRQWSAAPGTDNLNNATYWSVHPVPSTHIQYRTALRPLKENSMKPNLNLLMAAVVLVVASTAAHAHSFKLGSIDIGHPYARATVTGQPMGGGFLKLTNRGGDDRLLSATAAVSASVEMHSMNVDGDVMRMRQVDTIPLPGGKAVELKPGGYHLMFVGLKAPLRVGEKFPLKLKFEKAGEVEVMVNVEAPGAAAGPSAASASAHMH